MKKTVEKEKQSTAYKGLLLLSLLFAAGAVVTLLPNPGASWENIMGYKSVCTFAPIATAVCALAAGITCVIRARLFKAGVKETKRSWAAPAAAGIIIIAVLAFSIPVYARVKADAGTGASVPAAGTE